MTLSTELNYLSAVLLGVFGSVHCLGMCGGIAGALSFAQTRQDRMWRYLYPGCYALGRLCSYSVIGALAGSLGFFLSHYIALGILHRAAGVLIILMGISISGILQPLAWLERIGGVFWRKIQPITKKLFPITHLRQALLLGFIWGWLPCGLVYSTLGLALAQGTWQHAALLMFCFGVGTLPAVLASGLLAQRIAQWIYTKRLRYLAGAMMILLGIWSVFPVLQMLIHRCS